MHIVFLMVKDNLRDLPALPRLARDLGIGEIVLTNLVHVTTGWQDEQKVFTCDGPGDALDAVDDAVESGRALGVQVRRPSLSPRAVAVCEEDPLHTLYVSPHGEVSPCVYLHPPTGSRFTRIFCGKTKRVLRVSFGNVLREPIREIWEREGYAAFRKQLADRTGARGPLAALFQAGGAAPGRPVRPEPPVPCRTCHKMLGL
jgi:MoaA/NifB/PqqE/SkfB family radical SAM enzyme